MAVKCNSCNRQFILEKELLKHNSGCKVRRNKINDFYTKDLLIKEYIENDKTISEICNLTNFCSIQSVINLLKKFNIEKDFDIRCEYCNKGFENKLSKTSHLARCKKYSKIKENFQKDVLTQDFLIKEYIEKERSILDIIQEFPVEINYRDFTKILKAHGIKKRNISEAKLTNFTKNKYAETNLLAYGSSHNFNKNHPSRINWEKILFEEEGIINVFQRKEVIEKIANKIAEYNTDPRRGSRISSFHRQINEMIKNYNIKTKLEYRINNFYYDIFVEPNLIIEVNGNMFHANPIYYKSGDLLNNHIFNNKLVDEIWERDKIKNENAINNGYKLLIIWESDIKKDINEVNDKLSNFLGAKNENSKN